MSKEDDEFDTAHVAYAMHAYEHVTKFRRTLERHRSLTYHHFCQRQIASLFMKTAKRDDAFEHKEELYELLDLCRTHDAHVEQLERDVQRIEAEVAQSKKRLEREAELLGDDIDAVKLKVSTVISRDWKRARKDIQKALE